ncbi:hypothetical protein V8C44DRAFT_338059 [Trichoderma aethiopicum]
MPCSCYYLFLYFNEAAGMPPRPSFLPGQRRQKGLAIGAFVLLQFAIWPVDAVAAVRARRTSYLELLGVAVASCCQWQADSFGAGGTGTWMGDCRYLRMEQLQLEVIVLLQVS